MRTTPFALFALLTLALPASADVLINEIFFDPGGSGVELRDEFIELRGTPGMSLANHFLLFIENEDNASRTGGAGMIDNIFDLGAASAGGAASLGSSGFLTLRMGGDGAGSGSSLYTVASGSTDLVNTGGGPGYGSGATSSIGAQDDGDNGTTENGGFTAMLIRNDGDPIANRPTIAFDLDVDNNGLDVPTGRAGWTIIDAIGVHAEVREAVFGRTYAQVNFGWETIGQRVLFPGVGFVNANPGLEPGAEYVAVGRETEYIARWGNSTGQTSYDWHASNATDNPGSGSMGAPLDYRQSFTGNHNDLASGNPNVPPAQPTPTQGFLESNKNVPYGTKLLTTVGGPNYIFGDYNADGVVDAADYTVWRDTQGQLGTEANHPAADHNHDFLVNGADYTLWGANYGSPNFVPAPAVTIPEPTALAVSLIALAILAAPSRR